MLQVPLSVDYSQWLSVSDRRNITTEQEQFLQREQITRNRKIGTKFSAKTCSLIPQCRLLMVILTLVGTTWAWATYRRRMMIYAHLMLTLLICTISRRLIFNQVKKKLKSRKKGRKSNKNLTKNFSPLYSGASPKRASEARPPGRYLSEQLKSCAVIPRTVNRKKSSTATSTAQCSSKLFTF